jgi:hypothetical protein
MFWDNLFVPPSRILEGGIDRLSQTVGKDLEDGTDRFPETSVRNYHCSLCNNLEERSSQLKSEITHWLFNFFKNDHKWNLALILFIYIIYIPWIIRGKSHIDIGIINIDMNATRPMYIQYEYNYGISKQIIVK